MKEEEEEEEEEEEDLFTLCRLLSRRERERDDTRTKQREIKSFERGRETALCISRRALCASCVRACVSGAHPGERETV
jgi:ferredoxin